MQILELIKTIEPLSTVEFEQAKRKWNSLAKPLDGMGVLESHICKISAISGGKVDIAKRAVIVCCADNGVVARGVTQTSSDVTAIVAENIQNGNATVCHMSKVANVEVFAIDVGMNKDVSSVPKCKVKKGTDDFSMRPAMSRQDAIDTMETGLKIMRTLKEKGYGLAIAGEMGIGNTTTSSAVLASVLGVDALHVTGRGAGLSKAGVANKVNVINDAIALHKPNKEDALDIVSKVGGFDICAMCGMFLGAGIYKLPIIMDGFIASVAAILACMLCENVKDYIIPSHFSAENGARLALEKLGFTPSLNLSMALGEGTGAVALVPLLDMAIEVYKKMLRFEQTDVEEYVPL